MFSIRQVPALPLFGRPIFGTMNPIDFELKPNTEHLMRSIDYRFNGVLTT